MVFRPILGNGGGSQRVPGKDAPAAAVGRQAGLQADRSDKRRLLPFAEYFPWQSAGLLRREFGRVREFTPGAPRPPLPTVAGEAGVIVCNEALFPEPARERVLAGATLLLALTNDSWVGEPAYAEQATAMTIVRAIEQRRPLVRASTAGPSLIVALAGVNGVATGSKSDRTATAAGANRLLNPTPISGRRPCAAASARVRMMKSSSAGVSASGFSTNTCLPAAIAALTYPACR